MKPCLRHQWLNRHNSMAVNHSNLMATVEAALLQGTRHSAFTHQVC
jgi:hypothetical protein